MQNKTATSKKKRATKSVGSKQHKRKNKKQAIKKAKVKEDSSKNPTILHEIIILGLVLFAIFLLVALITHGLNKNNFISEDPKSLVGPVGARLGRYTFNAFGFSAFFVFAILICTTFARWNSYKDISRGLFSFKTVSNILLYCFLFCMTASLGWLGFSLQGGGEIGSVIAMPVLEKFGRIGTFIILTGVTLISVAVCSDQSIGSSFSTVFRGFFSFSKFISLGLVNTIKSSLIKCSRSSKFAGVLFFKNLKIASVKAIGMIRGIFRKLAPIRKEREGGFESTAITSNPQQNTQKNFISKKTVKISNGSKDLLATSSVEPQMSFNEWKVVRHVTKISEKIPKEAKENLSIVSTRSDRDTYEPPSLDCLVDQEESRYQLNDEHYKDLSKKIEQKLLDFKIKGSITKVHPGPVITLFEFAPAPGVKVGRIAALQDDLAMTLKARSIRIIAPLPKLGTVGIEVPNENREIVRFKSTLSNCLGRENSNAGSSKSILNVPLGKDTFGVPVSVDVAKMPHLLIAGATGTGKSVCINTVLSGLIYGASPAELGLILIDPKILELSIYEKIPHLLVPVVTVPKRSKAVLMWSVKEMDRRYRLMKKFGVRNIDSYNALPDKTDKKGKVEEKLPKIVIVIDELADLMLQVGKDIEQLITRLAQKARAAGIHLIVATQRPSVDVITGLIKANFPARISFRVSSRIDSRTILDTAGAERLLGLGDMLLMLPGRSSLKRIHGSFISDSEVGNIVDELALQGEPQFDENIMRMCDELEEEEQNKADGSGIEVSEYDPLYDKAAEFVVSKGQASTSMIQRFFRIGYNRAARIIDCMERDGLVGPMDGSKPRKILVQSNNEYAAEP